MSDTTPTEANIRAALRTRLRSTQRHHPDSAIVDELGICRGEERGARGVKGGRIMEFVTAILPIDQPGRGLQTPVSKMQAPLRETRL